MIDLEDMVKDILEMNYSIEERIETAAITKIGEAVERWMKNKDLDSYIEAAVELNLDTNRISEAIESALEEFVEDAI